ncbi:MAG: hypothetical protein JWM12_3467 [Ilumatobacteraceae bacterium]|jgi:hypothetical protein|nr:hypothetical protein [Ilumatobacteraceae bacterium]
MTTKEPIDKRAHDDHEHPILEAFNAEEVVEQPGEVTEEPDVASDADAPAP